MTRILGLSGKCLGSIVSLLILFFPVVGAQAKSTRLLYSFTGTIDGAQPNGGLIADRSGDLFGTTKSGGNSGGGVVFRLDPKTRVETVLYFFTGSGGGADGASPYAGVVEDKAGDFYGTTVEGGAYGLGTVFKLAPDGTETILHAFTGENGDGRNPTGSVILDNANNLYGTTGYGGDGCGGNGCGIVYKIAESGTETVLHAFAGGSDGSLPSPGLMLDSTGTLFGTTEGGGNGDCLGRGCGTVFKLTSDDTETVLYLFAGGSDGGMPTGSLIKDNAGNLYGTTSYGGGAGCSPAPGCGTVFRLAPDGTETVLYSFASSRDGDYPDAGLIRDKAGNFYGTTAGGGKRSCNCGTVFKLAPDGKKTVLYVFGKWKKGEYPNSLMKGAGGRLYDTAGGGGEGCYLGCGTIFTLGEDSPP